MRILIAGGAGFLGSHLCDYFLAQRHQVVCMDNLATGDVSNIAHLSGRSDFTFVRHDLTERIEAPGPLDWVLHFASPASPVDYLRLPIQTLEVGAIGTRNALEMARARGARFLLASTSEVYGDPRVNPQSEDYWGNVNPIGDRSVYDESKRFAEALTMAHHRTYGVDTRIARIFNTYGPRMRPNDGRAIPTFIRQALAGESLTVFGEGSQTRSFCYVSDLVEGIARLMGAATHQPVNLGNPNEMTMLELAKRVLALTGSRSPIAHRPLPQDDPQLRCPDITRARQLLGWEPRVSLDDGLRTTIEWFRASGKAVGRKGAG